MLHLNEKHEDEITSNFNKLHIDTAITNKPSSDNNLQSSINPINNRELPSDLEISNGALINKKGNKVTMGRFGIVYCSPKMEFKCDCCDGNCGPTDGCCCISCMEMNCQTRNIASGDLINKHGRISQFTKRSYYCGVEYTKESTNIFKAVFKKSIKCAYPHDACAECQVLTNYMKHYLSNAAYRKLMNV